MMEIKKIYGIDLGTTYSCIAHVDKNETPEIIPNSEGEQTTSSVVYFESESSIVVGKAAKQMKEIEPNRVVDFVKRSMGDESFSFDVDGKKYKPEEVSAIILKKLVKDASEYLGEEITDVVITCPAYFGIAEREATKIAGEIAGLKVHSVLNEPTAAAVSYGLDRAKQKEVILVYDLGGGTFDITVIEIEDRNISVITTGGNHQLGGKDWDDRLIEYFASEFIKENGDDLDPRDDVCAVQELRSKVEEVKKTLSAREKYKTIIKHNGKHTEIELTRDKFEDLTRDLMERTIEFTKNVVEEAKNKGYPHIDKMILVGGSTRMPMVRTKIKSDLGMEPLVFEPDFAVAKGAALFAYGNKSDICPIIHNISSKAFGIVVLEDDENRKECECVYHVIDRHSPLPAERLETNLCIKYKNQSNVRIQIMEQADGNSKPSKEMDNNKPVAEDVLSLPGNLPAGSPLHITFRLEEDGRLTVTALEPSSSKKIEIKTKVAGIMDEREVQESKEEMGLKIIS